MTGKNNKYPPHARDTESGVSEVIGAILLISVVVIAVSVIAVVLFSQQTPQKIPNVNIMVGTDNKIPPTLYLYHNGGDSLTVGEFDVLVDGVTKPYTVSGGGNEWSLGKNLVVPVSTVPKNVVLVYNSSGTGAVVLRSASVNVSTSTGSISPDVMSFPTPLGTCNIGNCSSDDIINAFMANVTANAIMFYKDKSSTTNILEQNQYFVIPVTGSQSTITWRPNGAGNVANVTNVFPGDTITITLDNSPTGFKVFGIAPQLWEFTVNKAKLSIVNSSPYNFEVDNIDITHTWITGYNPAGIQSTLTIHVTGDSNTALTTQNGIQRINGLDSREITIQNVKPMSVGLFLLEVDDSQHSVYFVGNATGIMSVPALP